MKRCNNCLIEQPIENNFCINCGDRLIVENEKLEIIETEKSEYGLIKLTIPNSLFILSNFLLLLGFISIIFYSTNKDYEEIFNTVRYEKFNLENISQERSYRITYNTAIILTKIIPFFSIVYILIYYLNIKSWGSKNEQVPLLDVIIHIFSIVIFILLSISLPDSNWVLSEVPLWIGLLYSSLIIKNVILK